MKIAVRPVETTGELRKGNSPNPLQEAALTIAVEAIGTAKGIARGLVDLFDALASLPSETVDAVRTLVGFLFVPPEGFE